MIWYHIIQISSRRSRRSPPETSSSILFVKVVDLANWLTSNLFQNLLLLVRMMLLTDVFNQNSLVLIGTNNFRSALMIMQDIALADPNQGLGFPLFIIFFFYVLAFSFLLFFYRLDRQDTGESVWQVVQGGRTSNKWKLARSRASRLAGGYTDSQCNASHWVLRAAAALATANWQQRCKDLCCAQACILGTKTLHGKYHCQKASKNLITGSINTCIGCHLLFLSIISKSSVSYWYNSTHLNHGRRTY